MVKKNKKIKIFLEAKKKKRIWLFFFFYFWLKEEINFRNKIKDVIIRKIKKAKL